MSIKETANRCNNPNDDEIIDDYMLVVYGMNEEDFQIEEVCDMRYVHIDEKYQIET
jgi:hypothetical protein